MPVQEVTCLKLHRDLTARAGTVNCLFTFGPQYLSSKSTSKLSVYTCCAVGAPKGQTVGMNAPATGSFVLGSLGPGSS